MSERSLVLVVGATGYVGGELGPRLISEGCRVRALVRDPETGYHVLQARQGLVATTISLFAPTVVGLLSS